MRDACLLTVLLARQVTTPDGETAIVPQFVDLREYDRLQLLQLNGSGMAGGGMAGAASAAAQRGLHQGQQADFEETIHRVSTAYGGIYALGSPT